MKIIIKKILRAIGSRMTYLLIGLSFSVVVIAVNAAIPWTNVPTRSSGQTLTSSDWNAMKSDLDSLRTAVDGQAIECVTKTASMSTCGAGWCNGTVDCDAGWIMTGGGFLSSQYDTYRTVGFSYPTVNGWYSAQQTDSRRGTVYVRCCR